MIPTLAVAGSRMFTDSCCYRCRRFSLFYQEKKYRVFISFCARLKRKPISETAPIIPGLLYIDEGGFALE
jgi:hypothetical protein